MNGPDDEALHEHEAEVSEDAEVSSADEPDAEPEASAPSAAPEDTFPAGGAAAASREDLLAAIEADVAARAGGYDDDEPIDDPGADTEERPGLEKAPPMILGQDHLVSVLASLIFVADKPLTEKRLCELSHATVLEVRPALETLRQKHEGTGIELHTIAGGFQFRSNAKNGPFVRALVAPKPIRMSRAQLETLSIVAYRQPVTRPEIDDIRGVDSGMALKMLAERDLIRILGRKEEPGRPLLYGTTTHFLEFFGLNSLRDLPTLREFSELSDESRGIFERRMGEPLDLSTVRAEAEKAEASMQRELFDDDEDDDEPKEDTSAGDLDAPGESSVGKIPAPSDESDVTQRDDVDEERKDEEE